MEMWKIAIYGQKPLSFSFNVWRKIEKETVVFGSTIKGTIGCNLLWTLIRKSFLYWNNGNGPAIIWHWICTEGEILHVFHGQVEIGLKQFRRFEATIINLNDWQASENFNNFDRNRDKNFSATSDVGHFYASCAKLSIHWHKIYTVKKRNSNKKLFQCRYHVIR